jgi:hypothetical protein
MDSHFPVWKMVQVGKSLSSTESGPRFLMDSHFSSLENGPSWEVTFQFGKWSKISDGQSFSSLENGPKRTVMV